MAETPGSGLNDDGAYLGTYKSKQDAEKGLSEKDATISRLANEVASAKAQADTLNNQVLAKLAEAQVAQNVPADDGAGRVDEMVSEMKTAWENGEEEGARKTLQVLSSYANDIEAEAERKLNEGISAVDEKVNAAVAEMERNLRERDPEWVVHRDEVAQLAEQMDIEVNDGNREMLLKFAKSMNITHHPERGDLPAGVGSTRVVASDDSPAISAQAEALLSGTVVGNITDEEKAALKRLAAERGSR